MIVQVGGKLSPIMLCEVTSHERAGFINGLIQIAHSHLSVPKAKHIYTICIYLFIFIHTYIYMYKRKFRNMHILLIEIHSFLLAASLSETVKVTAFPRSRRGAWRNAHGNLELFLSSAVTGWLCTGRQKVLVSRVPPQLLHRQTCRVCYTADVFNICRSFPVPRAKSEDKNKLKSLDVLIKHILFISFIQFKDICYPHLLCFCIMETDYLLVGIILN